VNKKSGRGNEQSRDEVISSEDTHRQNEGY